MKKYLTIILLLVLAYHSYSQTDSVKTLANKAAQSFTWDVNKEDKGSLMFLDVPYVRDNSDSVEYLTLTVAKDKTKQRPDFISIIVPNNVVQSNGIFIKFANTVIKDGDWTMELEKENPVRVSFESCDSESCTARLINGFAKSDEGTQEDIFKKFFLCDHVLFLFIYPDGSHKSVIVPLSSFKEQYGKL